MAEFGTFKKLFVTCCSLKSDFTALFIYFFNLILRAFSAGSWVEMRV